MDQNSLQPVSTDEHEPQPLSVAILGFEAIDEQSFRRFFQVSRSYQRKYLAASRAADMVSSAILMVNYDNPAALAERDAIISKLPHIPVVAVSRGPLDEPPVHHIRGMLFAARVLNTLDKVIVEPSPKAVAEKPQEVVVDAPQPATENLAPTPQVVDLPVAPVQAVPTVAETTNPTITPEVAPTPIAEKPTPAVQASTAEADTPAALPEPAPTAPVAVTTDGYRVLVVDDSPAIQKSLEINLATLSQIGMIEFADTGESALEKAEAIQYDLIFLDVMMPGIDGYETCTRLRKKPEYKKTPIIMVSGKTSPLDEVKGVMAGCTTYLTKPVQQEAFQKLSIRVLTWLEKQKKP
jgi:two-component system, cell cycle response regulator